MLRQDVYRDARGAVSIVFAGAIVPIVGMLGLAIDYTFLNQARTQMALAADTAAISAARLASSEFVEPVTSWQKDAETNGTQFFNMQLGALRGATAQQPTVLVTQNGTIFSSSVGYSGTVPTHFAALFGINDFNISGTSAATITINAYVNITLLLDNSGSMAIAATTNDINTMQSITACSPESMGSDQGTSAWTGPITPATCPTTYTKTPGVNYSENPPTAGQPPNAAACGFACHWSQNNQTYNGKPDYTQWDYYGLSLNPTKYGAVTGYTSPTLRFNVVQNATANVIQTMVADEVLTNQFGVAIYTFADSLTRIYPASGEAGYDLTTDAAGAQTAATGITIPVVPNTGNTDFPDSMVSLAANLTAGGDGSSSSKPKKNVFIVTDGIQDYGSRTIGSTQGPFSSAAAVAACNQIKAMGISIYVLYTPYTPLPYNPYYVSQIAQFVTNPPTPNEIIQALQACASSPSNYYEADIPSQITTGLNTLLKAAISQPARINS